MLEGASRAGGQERDEGGRGPPLAPGSGLGMRPREKGPPACLGTSSDTVGPPFTGYDAVLTTTCFTLECALSALSWFFSLKLSTSSFILTLKTLNVPPQVYVALSAVWAGSTRAPDLLHPSSGLTPTGDRHGASWSSACLGTARRPWLTQSPRERPGPLHTARLSLSYRLQRLQQPRTALSTPSSWLGHLPAQGDAPAESRTASVELTPCVSRLTRVMVLPSLLSSAPNSGSPTVASL